MQFLNNKKLLVFLFVVLFLLTRIPRLFNDEINPDAVNWHYRSEQFVVALKSGQFQNTYQHYHPGVSLMWIMGTPVELMKQFVPGHEIYNHENFANFHFISKLTLVAVQLVLTLLIAFYLSKLIGDKNSLIVTSIMTFEPFFIGNSRILHLDVLLTLFLFLGLILLYSYLKFQDKKTLLLSATFLAFGFLTKSIGIGALAFSILVFIFFIYRKPTEFKTSFKDLFVFLSTYIVTVFVFFPALWVAPVSTMSEIFSEGERVGIRKGHNQIVLGEETTDAGVDFYPLVFLIKLSPLILITTILGIIYSLKNKESPLDRKFLVFISAFYLTYLLVMTFPTKKLDRYMLVMFPFIAYLSLIGMTALVSNKKLFQYILLPFAALSYIYSLIYFFPYYFTYSSFLVGSSENANSIIAQKSFGMGVFELKDSLFKKYGEYPKIGFIDTKPMRAIYISSRIFDIREVSESKYDLVVLAVNEAFPDNIDNPQEKFVQVDAVYINGLEYWRIYAKKK